MQEKSLPRDGILIPLKERVRQLYSLGYDRLDIFKIVVDEFEDINIRPITISSIYKIVSEDPEGMEASKLNIVSKCKETIALQMSELFAKTSKREVFLVDVYLKKLDDVLNQLHNLDINEQDENGNYVNTARFFVLMEQADKLHNKVTKVSGTDAMKEIEVYRQKLQIKQGIESSNGLLPSPGAVIDEQTGTTIPTTKFIE